MQLRHRKWRIGLIVLFLLLLLIASVACSTNKETVTSETPLDHSSNNEEIISGEQLEGDALEEDQGPGSYAPFWRVEHNGNTIYLLGSIHVGKPELYPLHEKIEAAFAESQYLAVEVDLVNANILKLQMDMMNLARYSDGTTLKDHLHPYEYVKLKDRFKEYKMSIAMFEQYEPWFVASILETMVYTNLGYKADYGVDQHFLVQANGNKEIIELEDVDFQVALLDNFSEELQLVQIRGVLRSIEVQNEEFEQMYASWKSGNYEEFAAIVEGSISAANENQAMAEFNEKMLENRNIGMVDKIEGFLNSEYNETFFVVVGAAHYIGDIGIVRLLEDRGYTVVAEQWQ